MFNIFKTDPSLKNLTSTYHLVYATLMGVGLIGYGISRAINR